MPHVRFPRQHALNAYHMYTHHPDTNTDTDTGTGTGTGTVMGTRTHIDKDAETDAN